MKTKKRKGKKLALKKYIPEKNIFLPLVNDNHFVIDRNLGSVKQGNYLNSVQW